MLSICVQYPYRTCIVDFYVSNILTGHVYFETFVRVVFGRSLSGVCLIPLPDIYLLYVFNILTKHVYFDFYVSNILTGHVYFETFVRVVFGRSLSSVCLISLPDIYLLYVFNIFTEHVYFDFYVSNILTGHVYFETFVRVVFGRSLSSVCLISLPDIYLLYVFNILTEHVYSIFMCPISLPGMYIFETFVRVVFGRSLSSVCLISLPDICSLYVFNILTEHVYSIFISPISLPGVYILKPLLESSSVGLFPVYV